MKMVWFLQNLHKNRALFKFTTIKKLLFILFIFCFYFGLKAQSLKLGHPVNQWFPKQIDDYNGMATDEYGRLYFIDGNKLNRFHGYYDLIYSHENLLETIKIYDKEIKIGTSNAYGRLTVDSVFNYSFNTTFSQVDDAVIKISRSNYGDFILSKNKVFHFDKEVARKYSFPGIVDYLSEVNGNTIIHDDENGLSIFVNGKFKIVNNSTFLSREKVIDIKSINVGEYLLATEKAGVFLFDGESFIPFAKDLLENEFIQAMEVVKKSETEYEVLIVSKNNELISIDNSGIENFRKTYTNKVYDVHYSSKGLLYAVTSEGIDVFFYNLPFKIIDFTSDPIHGPLAIYEDKIYWGSVDGLSYKDINEIKQIVGKEVKIKDTEGKVGKLDIVQNTLIMTHEDGLYHVFPNLGIRFIPDEKFFNFTELTDGYIIAFGKRDNYLLKIINNKWRIQKTLDHLPIHPKSVVFDKSKFLWLVDRDYNLIRYSFNEENLELEEVSRESNNNKVRVFSFNEELILIKDRHAYEFDGLEFNLSQDLSAVLGDDIDVEQVQNDQYGNVWYVENGKVGIFRSFKEDGQKKYKKLLIDYPFKDPRSVFPFDKNNVFINNGDHVINIDLENYVKKGVDSIMVDRVYYKKNNGEIRNTFLLEYSNKLSTPSIPSDADVYISYLSGLRPDSKYYLSNENFSENLRSPIYVGSPTVFDNESFIIRYEDFYGNNSKTTMKIRAKKPFVGSLTFWLFLGIVNLLFWILAFVLGFKFNKLRERRSNKIKY